MYSSSALSLEGLFAMTPDDIELSLTPSSLRRHEAQFDRLDGDPGQSREKRHLGLLIFLTPKIANLLHQIQIAAHTWRSPEFSLASPERSGVGWRGVPGFYPALATPMPQSCSINCKSRLPHGLSHSKSGILFAKICTFYLDQRIERWPRVYSAWMNASVRDEPI